jgi:hypothetical protein
VSEGQKVNQRGILVEKIITFLVDVGTARISDLQDLAGLAGPLNKSFVLTREETHALEQLVDDYFIDLMLDLMRKLTDKCLQVTLRFL